jgi:hypothetical protein
MVKKLLVVAAAAVAAFAIVRRLRADSAEQDLWAEATRDTSHDLR